MTRLIEVDALVKNIEDCMGKTVALALKYVIDRTPTAEKQWIPAEEEFPPVDERVIVTDGRNVWIDELSEDEEGYYWGCGEDWLGTAWMPLPALPEWKKEGQNE